MALVFLKDIKYFYLHGEITTSAFGSRNGAARLKLLMMPLRKGELYCPQVALMCFKFKATLVASFFLDRFRVWIPHIGWSLYHGYWCGLLSLSALFLYIYITLVSCLLLIFCSTRVVKSYH